MTITNATLQNVAVLAQNAIEQIPEQRPCLCCGRFYGDTLPGTITRGMRAHTRECWQIHSDSDYPGEWIA